MPTSTHINVLPLGSYSMLLGINWMFILKNKVYCYDKATECLDDDGERKMLHGNKNPTLVRMVTTMQEKHNHKK